MNKLILSTVVLFLATVAKAGNYQETIEVVRGSATVQGIICSTGTASRLDTKGSQGLMGSGFNRAWARVQDQDPTYSVWVGFDADVSTDVTHPKLGEQVAGGLPGSNATYNVSRDIQIWCKAADGAGAAGARVSFAQWGFK